MSELAPKSSEILEDDILLAKAATSGLIKVLNAPVRLLSRIDSRHLDSVDDRPPTYSEALLALHAERGDHLPPGALAA